MRLLRYNKRMARSDRRLIEKIPTVGLAQIMAIKIRGRVGGRPRHDGVIIAVEDVYFLLADEFQGIDIAGSRFGVGLGERAAELRGRPRHAGAGRVHDRQHKAIHDVVGVRLCAPIRPARNHADALDHRRPSGRELDRHESAGRNAGYRAFADVGVKAVQSLLRQGRACNKRRTANNGCRNNRPAQHAWDHDTFLLRRRNLTSLVCWFHATPGDSRGARL
jgi:hypothetical protein